ncbi:hypothetical protein [Bacillus wiedmannii]|uniref:Uncharacterized protein n=1 Tax=Bacillus wiedmannii TaxID=1890302 RepID=A0ABX5E1B4_9BACI|nr:hypothetical protein [Bacillus wiedmannii]PRT42555.1 hypothetical protein C6357_00840 [Bacillus wiedmannii]
MKKKPIPKTIGDNHVKSVQQALLKSLNSLSINNYSQTTKETVTFIQGLYPNINSVTSKFDDPHPDRTNDLTLYLKDGSITYINLFYIKKGGKIQPKNLGAKSFLKKYFLSEDMQNIFNSKFEKYYLDFLKELVEHNEGTHYITDKKELKKLVQDYFPKFTNDINEYRGRFLFNLRETCFSLLQQFHNQGNIGFSHAFNSFFMVDDVNIITQYGKDENDIQVEKFCPSYPTFKDIELYKIGKASVGIKFGEVALTLRFKFESDPTTSIKLATSYHEFPEEQDIKNINKKTINKIKKLITKHEYIKIKNNSNAIGKCHEAFSYYYFLKGFPNIVQVDPNTCIELLGTYYSALKPETLKELFDSTSTIVPAITKKLRQKYNDYTIESIELIPDAYIGDRLDTGDLQLILKADNDIIVENISLKALSKKNSKITTKNPGIGTILGPTYFNAGSMESIVNEVKSTFSTGGLNHRDSLEKLSYELGKQLEKANQEQLRTGTGNLLGKAMMAITIYTEGVSFCKEHSEINSGIKVKINTPTTIQNTILWSNGQETISLRMKFSKGQHHGWSSVKLTSEYQLNIK